MSRNKAKRPKLSGEGFTGRFSYFIGRALINIRQNVLVNVLTVATITLALLILSLFMLVYVNVEGLAQHWSDKVQVTAYFDKELAPPELDSIKKGIQSLSGTDRLDYVTKQQALNRFRERLKGQESLLEGVAPDILPASLEIRLKRSHRDTSSVEAYVARLKKIPGISEVQYGEEWVKRFNAFISFMRLLGAILGGFIIAAVMFIVSNTIKLTIYARQDELDIMALVGATRFFIKAPFLVEGLLQGAAGALLAILLLLGSYMAFMQNAGNFLNFNPVNAGISFLPMEYLAGLFVGGVVLGFLGSLTSLKRFIKF